MPEDDPQRAKSAPQSLTDNAVYSEDGVDLTLVRWMLSLTPTQRLEVLQEHIWSIMRLRDEDSET